MLKISAVIAAYNDEMYIRQCVASVAAAGADEIIVVVDASTDGTLDVLKAMQLANLCIISLPENSGPSVARNVGMEAATHDLCAIIDADDWIPPDRLDVMSQLAEETGACVVVDDLVAFIDATGETLWRKLDALPKSTEVRELTTADMIRHDFGSLKPLINLAQLRQAGITYPTNTRYGEDFIFLLEIARNGGRIIATRKSQYNLRRMTASRLTSDRVVLFKKLLSNQFSYHMRHRWNLQQNLLFMRRHLLTMLALAKNMLQKGLVRNQPK